ncbi:hypothetical protein PCANC_21187 [Puccinia coronata f. sp. avenae]|uniref:Uncharacterized protein n=1 Tax=Puccinia coronata f. sp. avenae TaxID=200324 RepID=A0A2N5TYB0_9BASI|nr:hypothetical protein PCANC_21187 [Puccinia coronata f. sp. avenae]
MWNSSHLRFQQDLYEMSLVLIAKPQIGSLDVSRRVGSALHPPKSDYVDAPVPAESKRTTGDGIFNRNKKNKSITGLSPRIYGVRKTDMDGVLNSESTHSSLLPCQLLSETRVPARPTTTPPIPKR